MWLVVMWLVCAGSAAAQPPAASGALERTLRALVPAATADVVVDAAGLTGAGRRIWAVEPRVAASDRRPRLVLIGGLDGRRESAAVALRLVDWWFTDPTAAPLRAAWQLAVLPCARPDQCDQMPPVPPADAPAAPAFPPTGGFFDGKQDPTLHYVWRWVVMQAPTLVIDVRAGDATTWQANDLARQLVSSAAPASPGSLAAALQTAATGAAWSAPAPALRLEAAPEAVVGVVRGLLPGAAALSSPLRNALLARQARDPLAVARLLAPKYPAQPIMSYIPALSWSGALRLARLTGDARLREKPLADMAPFLSGARPAIAEPYLLTSLAGHLAFSDLAADDGNAVAAALAQKAAVFLLPEPPSAGDRPVAGEPVVRFPRAWTDDMFMATSVLARVGARHPEPRAAAAAGRLLTTYADQLQRTDGLFMHAVEGPHPWGRGNGFAAFGLVDALTYLPAAWPERPRVLASYRALMEALRARQAPDGLWRQVVDEPGSYREFTVTAMTIAAMARGIRLGWIEPAYRPVVTRAWEGLLARIAEDGTMMDVCTGTGSGPTRQYYLDRAGITGADDRGGAMALTAALEMAELTATPRR